MKWAEPRDLHKAKVLLILPCNDGAAKGNYFLARRYNIWTVADAELRDLRKDGRVAFAAVDSATLETQPEDPRGAIVLETEMERVRNADGEDWGAPSWRWFRPTKAGKWPYLESLTTALLTGVRRVESLGFPSVLALVNPRGYFLALAAAASECGVMDRWVLFRPPAHPNYLLPAIRQVIPLVRAAAQGNQLRGGIYPIPDLHPVLQREARAYRHSLPKPWSECECSCGRQEVAKHWASLTGHKERRPR